MTGIRYGSSHLRALDATHAPDTSAAVDCDYQSLVYSGDVGPSGPRLTVNMSAQHLPGLYVTLDGSQGAAMAFLRDGRGMKTLFHGEPARVHGLGQVLLSPHPADPVPHVRLYCSHEPRPLPPVRFRSIARAFKSIPNDGSTPFTVPGSTLVGSSRQFRTPTGVAIHCNVPSASWTVSFQEFGMSGSGFVAYGPVQVAAVAASGDQIVSFIPTQDESLFAVYSTCGLAGVATYRIHGAVQT